MFFNQSVVADSYLTYNRIDIRKGGIAYVQCLKIPPGDGGLISIRGSSLASRSYISAAGLALQHFLNSIGAADYNPSLLAIARGLWSSGRPGPGRAC